MDSRRDQGHRREIRGYRFLFEVPVKWYWRGERSLASPSQ